jgi:hypothetical protein
MSPAAIATAAPPADQVPGEKLLAQRALAFIEADKALRDHAGDPLGKDYEAKIAAWRRAYARLTGRTERKGAEDAEHAG